MSFQSTCPARGTTSNFCAILPCSLFQSTCPARGTTSHAENGTTKYLHFNPRAPRGARPAARHNQFPTPPISIHVPREGHDIERRMIIIQHIDFNPRAPRGARHHAPLSSACGCLDFNPRAPRGARRCTGRPPDRQSKFQSTCPARGTTSAPFPTRRA